VSDQTSESSADYVLLTQLADEFAARYRAGERPSLLEYIDRHPELADDIRDLFPAMVEMEQVREDHQEAAEQSAPSASPPLQQLGDFRILRKVGKGGMGIVYEAEQVSLGRRVALKVLPKTMLFDGKAKRRFEREAKSAAKLHHTNIVPVFGVGEQDGMPYYVMQFIHGLGLDEVLEELKNLQLANAETGTFAGGGLRVSRNVSPASSPPGEEPAGNAPRVEISALNVARTLLSGEFKGPMEDGDDADAGKSSDVVETQPKLANLPCTPASADSLTLSSSAVVLPGQSREGSTSKTKKRTYWQSVASIGVQVADALEYAHKQGINHRDIKPSNLLLDTQGTVWVTDFGLAKADDQQNLTHSGDILGTIRYMPPEAFEGKSDARGDVYSLGLTLYEMLAFRSAFEERERNRLIKQVTSEEPQRLRKRNRQVPADLETIVHKAIDKDPKQRYASAGVLAEDLRRFIEDEPITARRVSPAERLWRWCRRNPLLAATTGLAAAALVAVTIISTFLATIQAKSAAQQTKANEELRREQARTQEALQEVDSKLNELRKNSAWAAAERGRSLVERGEFHRGSLWLTRGLELAPPSEADLQLAIRTSLGSLQGEVPILRSVFPQPYLPISACISPDGKRIAIGGGTLESRKGGAQLLDLASGQPIGQALEVSGFVTGLAFSPDGTTLLTGSIDENARLWDTATGRLIGELALDNPGDNYAVAFSPDGKTIAIGDSRGNLRLWDAGTRKPIGQPLRHPRQSEILSVSFSPDGKTVATGSNSPGGKGEARLWEIATGRTCAGPFVHPQTVIAVAFSPDGKTLAAGGLDGKVQFWDIASGESIRRLDHHGIVTFVAFSPDGQLLLTAGDRSVRLWDVESGQSVMEPLNAPTMAKSVPFTPDGQNILIPGPDQAARLWSLPAGRQVRAPLPQEHPIYRLEISRDGKTILVATGEGENAEVRLWDVAAGKPIGPALVHYLPYQSVALAPDGRSIVMGTSTYSYAADYRLWDAVAGKPIGKSIAYLSPADAMAFSPDGRTVLIGGPEFAAQKGVAQLADPVSGRTIGPSLVHSGRVSAVAFSSDGRTLLTGSGDIQFRGEVRRWDARTGEMIGSPLRHQALVWAVAFSPDDKLILSASWDRTARLWDAATGKPIGLPLVHQGIVYAVAFSPDGKIAATAGDDKTVRLWDAATGLALGAPLRLQGAVYSLAFSPDGTTLLSGGADKMIRFWRVPRPVPGEVEQIKASVEVASGMTLSPEFMVSDLEAPAWHAHLEKLASEAPQDPTSTNPFVRGLTDGLHWHQQQALACFEAERWQCALWHLNRQISAQPDWLAYVLRTKANIQLDRLEPAAADFEKAFDLGSEQVLIWYSYYASEHVAKEQWSAAFWYLDRMVAAQRNDATVYVQRARAFVKRGRWKDAAADYSRAVELSRSEPQLWLEKAAFDDEHGQWKEAAKAFAEALKLDPDDHWQCYQSAVVHLHIGDIDGYRRHCREMLRRFGQTDDPMIAERIAKVCLIRPDAVDDPKLVQDLALRAVTNTDKHPYYPFFMLAKGLADYRAGDPEQAIDWLRKSLKSPLISRPPFNALAQLFLAMAYHDQGQESEARQALKRAIEFIDAELEKWKEEDVPKGDHDWLVPMIVRHEAEGLINEKSK
jgi:WD40 repeat protein/serine/threonine protein kinase/tetratricopeptide (TPR) repeat protein